MHGATIARDKPDFSMLKDRQCSKAIMLEFKDPVGIVEGHGLLPQLCRSRNVHGLPYG